MERLVSSSLVPYAYPLCLYVNFFVSPFIFSRDRATPLPIKASSFTAVWVLQLWLTLCALASVILATPPVLSAIIQNSDVTVTESYLVCYVSTLMYWAAGLLPDPIKYFGPSLSHCNGWIIASIFELLLVISSHPPPGHVRVVQSALGGVRIAILILMVVIHGYIRHRLLRKEIVDEERESLINGRNGSQSNYSTTNGNRNKSTAKKESTVPVQREGWLEYIIGFKVLFPYIWASDSRKQQALLVLSMVLMLCQRIVNLLVPYQLGVLIETIDHGRMSLKAIGLYILFRGLQGQQGVLGSIRAILWIPISQNIYRRLTCGAFRHILSLSLEFHLSKRIGEVMSALSKGSALNTFLDSFAFQLFPMVLDVGIAAVYFIFRFDILYSLILIGIMWSYLYLTIYMAEWRGRARREMAMKDRDMDAVKTDAMISYETVHHNGAVDVEVDRFADHVADYQKAEFSVLLSLNTLNITQNVILTFGILLITLLSSLQISVGVHTVAMFVSILAYYAQLQAPLQFFGSFYNQVQNNLIDSERMLNLFKIKPLITDAPNASKLTSCEGRIQFSNVSFAYDGRKRSIENLSFTAEPGSSTAIVGESGSGKSTCLKLCLRFYDVSDGSIEIDGRDIRDLTLESYRQHIGVVPQDTVLFNMSILYNIQYARPDATPEEIYEACRAASIHERILSFPDGYETRVGERGLRLSGGEKQRIAIARALLKNPRIILLDEATASLDSHTEKKIQGALEMVTRGRTTITIAHRLSTITKCDQILVLHEGRLVEKGTHDQLLELGGKYSEMWEKQTRTKDPSTEHEIL